MLTDNRGKAETQLLRPIVFDTVHDRVTVVFEFE
jgi:hypothetical protein